MSTSSLQPGISTERISSSHPGQHHSGHGSHSSHIQGSAPYGAHTGGYYLWVSGEPDIAGANAEANANAGIGAGNSQGSRGVIDPLGPINFDRVLAPRVTIDLRSRSVFANAQLQRLTYKEFELLSHLVQSPGRVVSREEIYAAVWQSDTLSDSRTIDVHVRRLREKLDLSDHIITVRGSGYKFILTEQIEILAPSERR